MDRIAPELAKSIAKLHCMSDFDPEFNTNVRPCMMTTFPSIQQTLHDLIDSQDPTSRAAQLAQTIGRQTCDRIVERNQDSYMNDRDCLLHSDLHAFNILVEKKPSAIEQFGNEGSFAICDFEMSMAGPIGRDIGIFHAFPAACAIAHAINGHHDVALRLLDFLEDVWEHYAAALVSEGGKSEQFLLKTYRNVLAWAGWFLILGFYILGCQVEFFPLDQSNQDEQKQFMDSVAVLGIKLLRWGFGEFEPDLSLPELRAKFRHALEEEIQFASDTKRSKRREKRSSVLRLSGRRVSDTALHFQNEFGSEGTRWQ